MGVEEFSELQERGQTLMCNHFLSLCIFHVCCLSRGLKQVTWPSPESMWEETGHVKNLSALLQQCTTQLLQIQPCANTGLEGSWRRASPIAGTRYPACLGTVRHPLGMTVVPDGTRRWHDTSGTTYSEVVSLTSSMHSPWIWRRHLSGRAF